MEKELEREIIMYGQSKCSRAIIEVAIDRILSRWGKPDCPEKHLCEEFITCQLYGYNITITIMWNSKKEKWETLLQKIDPIGRVQKFYEDLINDDIEAIMYVTGESILFCSLNKVMYEQYPIIDICEEQGFTFEMEVKHPDKENVMCYRLKPINE